MQECIVRLDEDFGKDEGILHEAMVTGRKVGAGRDFWSKLAHDKTLFRKTVALVSDNHELSEPVVVSPFFASEEVKSGLGYPAEYVGANPVCEQLLKFSGHFKELDTKKVLANAKEFLDLPQGAEGPGPFVVPYWKRVAKTYNEATERILKAIASERTFKSWLEGKSLNLRQSERTEIAFDMLWGKQQSDYFLVPAQFGFFHARPCRSVRRVRTVYLPHEFGLDTFAVGSMLLSHPERFISEKDLFVVCPGESRRETNCVGSGASCFYWHGGTLHLSVVGTNHTRSDCASATGFFPQ